MGSIKNMAVDDDPIIRKMLEIILGSEGSVLMILMHKHQTRNKEACYDR